MIRIRKLYLKSKLNFGKYAGRTVAEVIAIGEGPYLRWCNERMNKITFAPDTKQALKNCPIGHPSIDDDVDSGPDGYGDNE